MLREDEHKVQRRKWNNKDYKKRQKSVLRSRCDSVTFNTDKNYIYSLGEHDVDFCYLTKFYFQGTAYTKKSLASVFNRPPTTARHWTNYKLIPEPGFQAYVTTTGEKNNFKRWSKCYLYDEIMIMVYYINKIYESGTLKLNEHQPELHTLNLEIEQYRRVLKEKLENGTTDRIKLL